MYVPNHFKEDGPEKLLQYIRDYSFGTLILADSDGISVEHVPFYLASSTDNSGMKLQCHLARNNPSWQRIEAGTDVMAVFQGPDAYISPSWYATKAETGRVVPTWNYLAVHVKGRAEVIQEAEWLQQHLYHLTEQHEAGMPEPWSLKDAPEEFIDRLINAVVGIEISIESMTGKLKASQNQSEQNRAGVKAALESQVDENSQAMAKLIE